MWQDYGLSIIGFSFAVMLFPQLKDTWYGKFMNRKTALMTGLGLIAMGIIFATLGLWLTVAANLLVGCTWLTIFGLSYRKHAGVV